MSLTQRVKVHIYIVEVSCQLLDVLLQLIRGLQAVLEETGEQEGPFKFSVTFKLIGINTTRG